MFTTVIANRYNAESTFTKHQAFLNNAIDFLEKMEVNSHFQEINPETSGIRQVWLTETAMPECYAKYVSRMKELGINISTEVNNTTMVSYNPIFLGATIFQYIENSEDIPLSKITEKKDGCVAIIGRAISNQMLIITDTTIVCVTDYLISKDEEFSVIYSEWPTKVSKKQLYENLYKS